MRVISVKGSDREDNFHAMHNLICDSPNLLSRKVGAEIGVRYGIFSEYLMERHDSLTMYLVDPYLPYNDIGYEFQAAEQNQIKEQAHEKLKRFGHRCVWMHLTSQDAALEIKTTRFDFVFIDAEHTYESVKADIQSWRPKVRAKGLLAGHDFSMDGVKQAVIEEAIAINRNVHHVSGLADIWYIWL